MKYFISVVLVVIFIVCTPEITAQINGKNVVFVHGLQPEDLLRLRSLEQIEEAGLAQAGTMRPRMDASIYFHSGYRLSENSLRLYRQVKNLESQGTCKDGCYFVTASTGDLVTRYIINRLNQWGIDKNKFKVLVSFDVVGAGGGTEGADEIVSALNGNVLGFDVNKYILQPFLGFDLNAGWFAGIINDLRPSIARQTAMAPNSLPRVRIVGGKENVLLSRFMLGRDDGIVPMHSACGSARQEALDSCSRSIRIDGRIASAKGPSSLLYNHFPILMAQGLGHTEAGNGQSSGRLVALNNGRNFADASFNISERKYSTGWWIFKKHYRVVNKPESLNIADVFIDAIE